MNMEALAGVWSGHRSMAWSGRRAGHIVLRLFLYIALTTGGLTTAFPMIWMILTSFKTFEEANAPQIVWFPSALRWDAYLAILSRPEFLRAFANSIFVTALAVGGTLASITVVAYAFSRVEWPGRDLVFLLMLSTMMIPPQALIVPQYVFFNKLRWIGTYNPITIPGFFAGGAALVFLLRQFMRQIPRELDEAARIDGASHWQIFWHIILPLCRPALATAAVFLFVAHWNSLLQPLIYLQTTSLYTLPIYVTSLVNPQQVVQPWPTIMAASFLTALPLIVVFLLLQRHLIGGIVLTGMKG